MERRSEVQGREVIRLALRASKVADCAMWKVGRVSIDMADQIAPEMTDDVRL